MIRIVGEPVVIVCCCAASDGLRENYYHHDLDWDKARAKIYTYHLLKEFMLYMLIIVVDDI